MLYFHTSPNRAICTAFRNIGWQCHRECHQCKKHIIKTGAKALVPQSGFKTNCKLSSWTRSDYSWRSLRYEFGVLTCFDTLFSAKFGTLVENRIFPKNENSTKLTSWHQPSLSRKIWAEAPNLGTFHLIYTIPVHTICLYRSPLSQ